jgi:hypothetical protein
MSDDCHICGRCWWVHCTNDADYTMDVDLKRRGLPLYSGRVELCGGHARLTHSNGGRLDLNWLAVEQALALEKARA